jgi:hypothetical protein
MRKVLTQAGGGIFGVGPATYLAGLEAATGESIQDLVDAFAGTSVGAVNSGLFGCGFSAKQVRGFYSELASAFFGHKNLRYTLTKCGPQYDDAVLLQVLKDKCRDRTMSETVNPTYITAWNVVKRQLKVFGPGDKAVPVWYAIRASMSAPTYFGILDGLYGDGGLAANDPLLVGFSGVVADDSVDYTQGLKLLNLVTSGTTADGDLVSNRWFITTLLSKLILPALTAGNSADVEYIRAAIDKWTTKHLGGGQPRLQNYRVTPPSPDWPLDSADKVPDISKIWADQFTADKTSLLNYLTGV